MVKDVNLHIQKVQQTPHGIKPKKNIAIHVTIKLLKTKVQNENLAYQNWYVELPQYLEGNV